MQPQFAPLVAPTRRIAEVTDPAHRAFLAGLRERRIVGLRSSVGHVVVPPTSYDVDALERGAWVDVADHGWVTGWSWVQHPARNHPLQRPFAWATIRLDGAHTGILHAVDTRYEASMRLGMRVRARWAIDRVGHWTDLQCFEPAPAWLVATR